MSTRFLSCQVAGQTLPLAPPACRTQQRWKAACVSIRHRACQRPFRGHVPHALATFQRSDCGPWLNHCRGPGVRGNQFLARRSLPPARARESGFPASQDLLCCVSDGVVLPAAIGPRSAWAASLTGWGRYRAGGAHRRERGGSWLRRRRTRRVSATARPKRITTASPSRPLALRIGPVSSHAASTRPPQAPEQRMRRRISPTVRSFP